MLTRSALLGSTFLLVLLPLGALAQPRGLAVDEMNLNTLIQSFPSNFVANFFKFTPAEFFEIGDAAAREVPKVDFKK